MVLKKYLSYLEWIELVYLNHQDIENQITLNKIAKKDVLKAEENQEEQEKRNIELPEKIDYEKINEILNWQYKYKEMTNIQSKMSVTKIKELKNNETQKQQHIEIKPKFMLDKTKVSAAEKGTITHLILQKLDFTKEYSKEELAQFVNNLCTKNIITQIQKDSIDIEKIYQIINTQFIKNLKNAKEIKKETPFYTYINTKEIYNTQNSENILVQGIIDLYYINQQNEVILVDYKTDYVEGSGEELIDKYKVQLEIYKKALEESLKEKVKHVYIYSIYLNKEIEITF